MLIVRQRGYVVCFQYNIYSEYNIMRAVVFICKIIVIDVVIYSHVARFG